MNLRHKGLLRQRTRRRGFPPCFRHHYCREHISTQFRDIGKGCDRRRQTGRPGKNRPGIATLDPKRFDLSVNAEKSQLSSAQANYSDKKSELERQRQLFKKGWVAKAAIDRAVAAFDSAARELNPARSRLGSVEKDRADTILRAPFDGVIATRDVEPFEEIASGKALFLVNSEAALEVDLSVPDSIISRISVGAPATVRVSTVPGCGCSGRITEIGTASGSANTVPVKVALLEKRSGLLPGMSAKASVTLSGGETARSFLVPLTAIAPGDKEAQGYVFKFNADSKALSRVPVRRRNGVRDNYIAIAEGVGAGDILATAGVGILRDGQRVKLLGE
jgi:RND family efflux transporter MFP subunit